MNRLTSVWKYEGVVRKAILKLKYTFASDVVVELVEKFVGKLDKKFLPKKVCLVPVPMHSKRKKWRGFNQAEEMGKIVAEKLGWHFVPDLLVRTKHARPQTELKGEERKKNVEGVFSINPNHSLDLKCNTLVIFDDVWTTGSTLKEAVKALKRKNKKLNVVGMVVCS
jgi:ComF family protein